VAGNATARLQEPRGRTCRRISGSPRARPPSAKSGPSAPAGGGRASPGLWRDRSPQVRGSVPSARAKPISAGSRSWSPPGGERHESPTGPGPRRRAPEGSRSTLHPAAGPLPAQAPGARRLRPPIAPGGERDSIAPRFLRGRCPRPAPDGLEPVIRPAAARTQRSRPPASSSTSLSRYISTSRPPPGSARGVPALGALRRADRPGIRAAR